MKFTKIIILFLLFIFNSNHNYVYCQSKIDPFNKKTENQTILSLKKLQHLQNLEIQQNAYNEFKIIEKAIIQGDISVLTSYFNSRTYLNLANGVSGYYSNNQVYYVLNNYFLNHRVKSFSFSEIVTNVNTSYAIGSYDFNTRNGRKSLRVYVSLKKIQDEWKILQITFNK